MSMRRRRRRLGEKPKATVDMTSLIDLTFLLLVTFIVTLPALEQSVHILLPTGKADRATDEKKRNLTVTIDKDSQIFVGETPIVKSDLRAAIESAVKENPDVNVLIRGDIRVDYGDVYDIVKIAKDCNVKSLGLVSDAK